MLSALTIDDQTGAAVTLHESTTRAVSSVAGLVGIAPVRRNARTRPTADGSIDDTRYLDEAIISVVGQIFATTVELAFTEFRLATAPMIATLGSGAPALMKWTEGSTGLALQRLVKLAGPVQPLLQEGAAILNYQASFASADPRAYSQTLTTTTVAGVSGSFTSVFNNVGNTTTRPILRAFGPVSNGSMILGAGPRIDFTTAIASGDFVDFDLQLRTATLNHSGVLSNFASAVVPVTSSWFALPVGTSTVQWVFGGGGSQRLDVIGRSAYL